MDLMKQKALRLPCLHVNPRRVFNYLHIRQGFNGGLSIGQQPLPTLEALESSLHGLTENLVDNALHLTSELEREVERQVQAGEDVAGVRSSSANAIDEEAEAVHAVGGRERDHTTTIPLDHRAVMSRFGNDGEEGNLLAIKAELEGVHQAFADAREEKLRRYHSPPHSDEEVEDGPPPILPNAPPRDAAAVGAAVEGPIQVPRTVTPLSEFQENDKLLYNCFWYEFLLQKGLQHAGGGPLDVSTRRHLMLQFTNIFAENSDLMFLLANQTQRHAFCRGVNARVRSDPQSFEKFSRLVNDDLFKVRLEKATKNPSGKDAREILQT
eukprot:454262-Pyramimonas_sp.AAC.1